jgi:hypothetical protein
MSTLAAGAPADEAVATGSPTVALIARRVVRVACVPLFFIALLLSGVVGSVDGGASPSAELRAYAAPGAVAGPFVELAAAVLLVGLIGAFTSMIRRRGSWWANAGALLGAFGVLGQTFVVVRHFYDVALAVAPHGVALQVLSALDAATGPLPLLLIAVAPLGALLLLAIAAFRAGYAGWVALSIAVASLVLVSAPLPEWIGLAVATIVFGWIGWRMLRAPRDD